MHETVISKNQQQGVISSFVDNVSESRAVNKDLSRSTDYLA